MGARGTHRVDTTKRLENLRELMRKSNVQAFVVPSEDQRAFSPDNPIFLLICTRRERVHCAM